MLFSAYYFCIFHLNSITPLLAFYLSLWPISIFKEEGGEMAVRWREVMNGKYLFKTGKVPHYGEQKMWEEVICQDVSLHKEVSQDSLRYNSAAYYFGEDNR